MRSALTVALGICLCSTLTGVLHAQGTRAEGTVESIDFLTNTISIKLPDGSIVEIVVGKETELLYEREKSSLDAIKYGENIWASYRTVDGKNEAIKVIVTKPEEKDETEIAPLVM